MPHGPLDLLPLPSKIRVHGKVEEFVKGLQEVHKRIYENLVHATAKYKSSAKEKYLHVEFEVGNFVWVVLTKDWFSVGDYNKLFDKKIGPIEIIENISPNS